MHKDTGHDRCRRRPAELVPITALVDTSSPHNAKNHIKLAEMKSFRKAVVGGGKRSLWTITPFGAVSS